jgi:hypothetical protein
MEVLYPRCAGLDVHAGSITACARIATGAQVTYDHRTVPTTTRLQQSRYASRLDASGSGAQRAWR